MARLCPQCGRGMTDDATFCGQCGTRFEDYLVHELPSGGTSAGGMVLGDTGMLKGNLANAPASVGGIHIAVGGERGTPGTAQPALREHCPICGKLIREDDDYYRCPKGLKNNYVSRSIAGGTMSTNHFSSFGSRLSWASTAAIASWVKVTPV